MTYNFSKWNQIYVDEREKFFFELAPGMSTPDDFQFGDQEYFSKLKEAVAHGEVKLLRKNFGLESWDR